MIKLFRKIRQKMFTENKFSKYLIYAIGEIILVVIGILIALQLNTWKENKKEQQKVKTYLNQFQNDLKYDISTLTFFIKKNETQIKNIDNIVATTISRKELSTVEINKFIDLHQSLVYESYFIPEKSTYSQLIGSSEGDFFKNKNLITLIFRYYSINDRNEKNQEVSTQLYQHNYFTEHITNAVLISSENFNRLGLKGIKRPNIDLENLSLNNHYVSSIWRKRNNAESQNKGYLSIKKLAENLLIEIENELKL